MSTVEKIKTQVVVIGAGPGGYVCAIRLGQLGKKVALIDKGSMGGVCLNWGCIPSKALIHAAKVYDEAKNSEDMGITCENTKIDLAKTQNWKQSVISKLTAGVAGLVKNSGGKIYQGSGSFLSSHEVEVQTGNGKNYIIEFEQAVIACGSKTIEIPGFSIANKKVFDSKEALDWTQVPKSLAVIGGGVIGLEIGMLYQKLGAKVSIVELTDQLLPGVDAEVAKELAKIAKKKGLTLHLGSKAKSYSGEVGNLTLKVETSKGEEFIPCEKILLAVGRAPFASIVTPEKAGIHVEKNHIPINDKMQSNISHIYAIGDVTGGPLLAHRASKQGLIAAEQIAGHTHSIYDVKAMPGAIFTDPEVATVGLSEQEAQQQGIEYTTAKFPFVALGRALSTKSSEGFVKMIASKKDQRVLGVHIIGAHASDLISEATLAIEMGATVEDIALTVHPHPTMGEIMMECAETALGLPIHIASKKTNASTKQNRSSQSSKDRQL
ncbi:MAG: dihydrolipoyl dehydrogenase [Bdellovibrionales bacterium]|nr:dihydrolipoyl dehydrogenase [Bdellovibrionales bacterium]